MFRKECVLEHLVYIVTFQQYVEQIKIVLKESQCVC